MTDPLIQLDCVGRRLGDSFTLAVERLEVFAGEILCLVGPTGAGKSTVLKLLSGLDPPHAGQIRFDNVPLIPGKWPLATSRRIATVAQRPALLSGTVRYNVEVGLRMRGSQFPSAKTTAILDRLNLKAIGNQDARTLSGGQAQLVALARALVVEPDLLLLDEPTASLDPAYVALVEQTVQEQRQRTGMTIVLATHNLFQARRLATRTALLLGGNLVEIAETARFFERPSDQRTVQFVEGIMVY
ncbi:MAG: ATP-binding cassette domain-containing protein [Pirellulaceae bacterium]